MGSRFWFESGDSWLTNSDGLVEELCDLVWVLSLWLTDSSLLSTSGDFARRWSENPSHPLSLCVLFPRNVLFPRFSLWLSNPLPDGSPVSNFGLFSYAYINWPSGGRLVILELERSLGEMFVNLSDKLEVWTPDSLGVLLPFKTESILKDFGLMPSA